jgi:hypothetical protein
MYFHERFSQVETPGEDLKVQREYFQLYDSLSKEEQQSFKQQLDEYVKRTFESIKNKHHEIQKMD